MALEDMIERVQQAVDVRRVFGEPYVRDGVTVIPVAAVRPARVAAAVTIPSAAAAARAAGSAAAAGRSVPT